MELNEIIEQNVSKFKERLFDKSTSEKELLHYYSVLNISKSLVVYNDSNTISYKEKILEYFKEVENYNYLISDKLKSVRLYKKYLLATELFLFKKENFLSNTDLRLLTIIGIIIDVLVYFLVPGYYYPIFILLFFLLGVYRRKQAKKEGKYATMFW